MAEVYFDKLEMNHVVDFRKRLEVDRPTLSLAELLLAKLQIVKINEKDLKDAIVMLLSHEVGEDDNEMINVNALVEAGLLSDWSFYYTLTTNLQGVRRFAQGCNVLTENDAKMVGQRVGRILDHLERQPKSPRWKLRAKIGTSKKWYNDVDDWSGA